MTDLFEWLGAAKAYDAIIKLEPKIGPSFVQKLLFWAAWERAKEKEWRRKFYRWSLRKHIGEVGGRIVTQEVHAKWLIDPPAFFRALEGWRKEKGE
jgi:hypothetical protein